MIHSINQENQRNQETDPGLQGNERIEAAIAGLQQEASQERLAHTLTVIRQRMREGGQVIIAVEPPKADGQLRIQAVQTENGQSWWIVFSSFEEELKGSDSVKSTFLTDMRQLFNQAVQTKEIQGIILNPWNRTLMLDKALIWVILGQKK